ncbi:MAG TPA: histidine phosphatase family protein [Terriglobales bacterium]|nr:histidine phosphatase family protein [Terriglobales bacterium]
MTAGGGRVRRLVLVRHGETVGESSIRYHGRNDVALNDSGREQMRQVAEQLAGESFQAVYASRLCRSLEAAQIIAPSLPPQAIPGFDEIHFGDWEGLTREEIAARDDVLYQRWRAEPHEFDYPGGESVLRFRARVAAAWQELEPCLPARALLVAHKGVIGTILLEALSWSRQQLAEWPIELGSVHVLTRTSGIWSVAALGRARQAYE